MANSSRKWLSIDSPTAWADVFARSIKAAVVAFVVLQLKEWFDAGAFDTPATAVDAALIAGATFVLNAILKSFVAPSVYLGLGSSGKSDPSRSQLG